MWMRRLLIAAAMLVLPRRFGHAQQVLEGGRQPPFDQINARDVFEYRFALDQAFRVATRVDPAGASLLIETIRRGFATLEVSDTPLVTLVSRAPGRVPNLIVAQRNATALILAALEEGKTPDGQVILTESAVTRALRRLCPLYPFC